ncbi:MAG: serine/threonine protein kinase, partial [Phycisphaerae bacterium]|nr:serine/threonine protein kinase [Phycisphaerae bacterium]
FPGFDVVREIHRGGQGVVFQAIQRATKRKVAIKVFHEGPFAGARDRARFEREVDILATLDHPNIVGILDRGVTDDGSFFFVMDYVSGKTLDVFMADSGRSIDEMLVLFGKICDAVNAAHLKGIIHRDLKPSNIRVDQAGEPHVLDFGLAKTTTSEVLNDPEARLMTMTGQFIGSLPWASPEQASGAGANVDIRADVYSLGVILYQLLTGGRFPYPVIGNMRDVLDNIMRAEPAKPSTIRRQINDEVETIVLKSLSKDRERRYQSAGDLSRDVKRYLAGEPIEAKRDSGWYLLHKTIRRHKGSVGAAAAFVMLLAASSLVSGFLYSRAAAARVDAEAGEAAAVAAQGREQAQREVAERNFRAVRGLARAFIFDFNNDVAGLRGSTAARERILSEALAYLNKVKDQAEGDAAFTRELADAYEQVGDIQGGLFMPNVGGSFSADASYAESRRLRERALTMESPVSAGLMAEHASSLQRTAWGLRRQRKHAEAAAELRNAVARMDSALETARGGDVAAVQRFADQRERLRIDLANTLREQREPRDPSRMDEARAIYDGSIAYWKGRVEATPGDDAVAKSLGEASDARARVDLELGQSRRGAAAALLKDGKKDEAERAIRESMPLLTSAAERSLAANAEFSNLAARHPANARFRRNEWLSLHNAGDAKMRLGSAWADLSDLLAGEAAAEAKRESEAARGESLALFERALAIAESLFHSDEANLEAQRDVAIMLNKVGTVLIDLGQWERSRTLLDRSVAVREEVFRTDATHQHRRDLAQAVLKRGLLDRERVSAGAVAEADRREVIESAIGRFQQGLTHLQVLIGAGVLSEKESDVVNAVKAIETCRAMLAARGKDE